MDQRFLERLFLPLNERDFFRSYENNEPLLAKAKTADFADIFQYPDLKSLDHLLSTWQGDVNSYKSGVADEVNSQKVSPTAAKERFQQGYGLFFDDVNNFWENINAHLQQLRKELGFSQLTYSRALVYAIAAGQGTATHFDQNWNFVFQISGEKKWWVAPNHSVTNPLTRHTLNTETDIELTQYLEAPFPEEMPLDAKEMLLSPGDVLFLPRGSWHKTEAKQDSLSLNFTYSPPSWMDLLNTFIKSQLSNSPQWRASANFKSKFQSHNGSEEFESLIKQFTAHASHLSAEEIINLIEDNESSP